MTALLTLDDSKRLFDILPRDRYRTLSLEIKVNAKNQTSIHMRVYVSEDEGSASFTADSWQGLMKKVEQYYAPALS